MFMPILTRLIRRETDIAERRMIWTEFLEYQMHKQFRAY
jgi:hypothetical protein